MQPWKILTKLLLITLLALSASGVVSAKVASGLQNLSPGLHQGETVFNPLTHLAKIDFSTTLTPGSPVVTKEGTTVIGRVKDLQKLNKGEKSLLDRLPNQGSPKANWKQNSGVLRQEMNKGQPIRDASPGDTAGQFLNAERNLLRDRGWTLDPKTNYWNPPK